jgi:hypothetical protein
MYGLEVGSNVQETCLQFGCLRDVRSLKKNARNLMISRGIP